jgi:hypothetical protein
MPKRHALELRDVDPRRLESVLLTTYERAPQDFETLLGRDRSDRLDALKRLGRFAKDTEPKAGTDDTTQV